LVLFSLFSLFHSVIYYTSDVYFMQEEDVACYRIPTLISLPNMTLLAFAEARLDDCGDNGAKWIVMKRSGDGGKTWGDLQVIGQPQDWDCWGNPMGYYDKQLDVVFLQFVDMVRGQTFQVTSTDRGLTWSSNLYYISFDQLGVPSVLPGPGLSLKVKNTTRTIYCGSYFDLRGAWSTVVYYTDDYGYRYKPGNYEQNFESFSECQVVELKNGSIMLLLRNNNNGFCYFCQGYSLSHDQGESWSAPMPAHQMVNPIVFASLIEHQNAYYWSVPNSSIPLSPGSRGNVTVFKSFDPPHNWAYHQVIYNGPSAYSVLAGVSKDYLGILYENGVVHTNEKISFSLIST